MSKYKVILSGLLDTAYQMSADEIAELLDKSDDELNEKDVLKALKDKDKDRISELKSNSHDDGFKKAEKKIKSEVERKLKDRFEIDSAKVGDELIDEILESVDAKTKPSKTKELSDDDVKRHPVFVQMENNLKKQLTDQKTDFETQMATKQKEYQRKEVFDVVGKNAMNIFEAMKPILSPDPAKAANQKNRLLSEMNGYDFEIVEGRTIISKDGKVLEDGHGNKVDFKKFVEGIAEQYYDFQVAEDRQATGTERQSASTTEKNSYKGNLPKTRDEYLKMIIDQNIPLADRIALKNSDQVPADFKE